MSQIVTTDDNRNLLLLSSGVYSAHSARSVALYLRKMVSNQHIMIDDLSVYAFHDCVLSYMYERYTF